MDIRTETQPNTRVLPATLTPAEVLQPRVSQMTRGLAVRLRVPRWIVVNHRPRLTDLSAHRLGLLILQSLPTAATTVTSCLGQTLQAAQQTATGLQVRRTALLKTVDR